MAEQKVVGWGWAAAQYKLNNWTTYKITQENFERLWTLQEGKCAGCRGSFAHPYIRRMETGFKPEIDHKHTDKPCVKEDVRGLLCRKCNDFLGKMQDNATTLENLLAYLKQPPGSFL